uniref:Small ribosomal subunit protein uS3m n=1 Tax=Sciadopitys verticillata TaxID=28979 RepID=A0A8H2SEQ8_SCIVE|nr:ribosomal protein S3 [Sciadopitys verticillata]BDC46286.1 ribosomal protein S3 [Sciadopitys verticillata]
MAPKVNPISVRLHLNRSSDSSWFSDYYYGQFMYQDVNLREYFGSIRSPTRKRKRKRKRKSNSLGFRLGRCILHHSPKRTFIHLFIPRRPQLFKFKFKFKRPRPRRRGRGRSKLGRRWAIGEGWSIGPDDGTEGPKVIYGLDSTTAPSLLAAHSTDVRSKPPSTERTRPTLKGERSEFSFRPRTFRYDRERRSRRSRAFRFRRSIDFRTFLRSIATASIDRERHSTRKRKRKRKSRVRSTGKTKKIRSTNRSRRALGIYALNQGEEGPEGEGSSPKNKNSLNLLTAVEERRRAGETVKSIRLDDRSGVIWRTKQRYGYHDRSPSSRYFLPGDISKFLRAHKPMSVSNHFNDGQRKRCVFRRNRNSSKCLNFLLPRIHSSGRSERRRLLQTIPAVRPSSNYLVMQYPFHIENHIWIWPVVGLNHFVAPDSSSLDKRIRFFVESLTAKTRFATTIGPTRQHLPTQAARSGPGLSISLERSSKSERAKSFRYTKDVVTSYWVECSPRSPRSPSFVDRGPGGRVLAPIHYLDRSLLFPFLGATLLFLRDMRVGGPILTDKKGRGKRKIYYARQKLLGKKRKRKIYYARQKLLGKKRKRKRKRKIYYARQKLLGKLRRKLRNDSGLVEKFIDLGGIGGLMRGIGMMIGIILKNRRIPYAYNYYLNEVRKMRSLLSDRTNTHTFIGSVKIESVYQSASPIAQDISLKLRDRTRSFRSIFNQIVREMPRGQGVRGIRICCSGRSKGAEIARTECREYGKTSCNAFCHKIDYAYAKVSTRYGILGVKVWIPFP